MDFLLKPHNLWSCVIFVLRIIATSSCPCDSLSWVLISLAQHSRGMYLYTMCHVAKLKRSALLEGTFMPTLWNHDWEFGHCGVQQLDRISAYYCSHDWNDVLSVNHCDYWCPLTSHYVPLNITLSTWNFLSPFPPLLLPLTNPLLCWPQAKYGRIEGLGIAPHFSLPF